MNLLGKYQKWKKDRDWTKFESNLVLKEPDKGNQRYDQNNTARTCYQCGKIVREGKILIDPLLGFLLYCEECFQKESAPEKQSEVGERGKGE